MTRTAYPRIFAQQIVLVGFALSATILTASAYTQCRGPQEWQARLRAHPSAETYGKLAIWFGNHRQYVCAAKSFHHAAALQPSSPQYAWMEGVSLISAGETEAALVPLQRALRLEPKLLPAHLALATAFEQLNHRSEADSEWRSALELDPNSTMALEHLSKDLLEEKNYASVITWLQPVGESPSPAPQLAANLSIAYAHAGLMDQAIQVAATALKQNPRSLDLAAIQANNLLLANRAPEAVELMAEAAARHPGDFAAQVRYLRTLVIANDPRATTLARTLTDSHPGEPQVLYLDGILAAQSGENARAERDFEHYLAASSRDAGAHYRLALALIAQKKYAGARMHLEKAIALGLNTPEAHFEMAGVLRALGNGDAAQQEFALYRQAGQAQTSQAQLLLELDPQRFASQQAPGMQTARMQAALKAELGDDAEAKGDLQQAIRDFRNALAIDPQEPLLDYKLAMALDKTGDRAAERAVLDHAIKIDPDLAVAQNQLGYLDSRDGNSASAIEHFQQAVAAYPGYTRAWMNLAAALCLESRWKEAKDALDHVLQLDPGNATAKDLMQRLNGLGAAP